MFFSKIKPINILNHILSIIGSIINLDSEKNSYKKTIYEKIQATISFINDPSFLEKHKWEQAEQLRQSSEAMIEADKAGISHCNIVLSFRHVFVFPVFPSLNLEAPKYPAR